MPTWPDAASFARDLGKVQRDIEREQRNMAMDMAKAGQKIAESAASSDLGGDPKFSGWAPTLDTRVRGVRNGAILSPTRSSAGPWTVAERGRNQGNASGFQGPGVNRRTGLTSRTKSGGVRKVRSSGGRRWNGRTAGKNTASDAVAEMDRKLPQIAERETRKVLQRHFDVS